MGSTRVMGVLFKSIVGYEKEQLLTLFHLIDPVHIVDYQQSITEMYHHANKTYIVNYLNDGAIEIDEVLNEKS